SDGLVRIRHAKTGAVEIFDMQGKPATGDSTVTQPGKARLTGPNTGTIDWTSSPGGRGRIIEVNFDNAGMKLLSVQPLAMESSGSTYVVLESSRGGDAVDLNKSVRRYSPDGKFNSETTDLPLDYFVRPTDEIRVRSGVVYQLMPAMSEVRINVWD